MHDGKSSHWVKGVHCGCGSKQNITISRRKWLILAKVLWFGQCLHGNSVMKSAMLCSYYRLCDHAIDAYQRIPGFPLQDIKFLIETDN
ncbi:hypothetical protein NPIL_580941 [Nephila pilipes]|uniref:Uncharacterized protein n=1 Tax=Nephila pilipes TaxID=299642 RepID=A0A8X6QRW7_NEPPI|nr:hypothetical protein NPIL_580941 [Nephila pilipes]